MPPATSVTSLQLAEHGRQIQADLHRQVAADVIRSWSVLDFSNLTRTWPTWLAMMSAVLASFNRQSAQQGALLYGATRQLELGEAGTAVALAAPPAPEWVSKALGYAAPGTYEIQGRAGAAPGVAQRTALTKTLGVSSRIVMDGARTTVADATSVDKAAVRWYRVTDGDPCAFCALMATRGAVYRSVESAGQENTYHDDCGCVAVPSFTKTIALSGPAQEAVNIYRSGVSELPNDQRLAAFRAAWNARKAPAADIAA